MRDIQQRILVAKDVAQADKYAFDFDNGALKLHDLVIYNPRTGKTLGPGVTYADVPVLGVAQAVDFEELGYTNGMRKIFSGGLDGASLMSISTEQPRMPVNGIKNMYIRCVPGDDIGVSFEWRNDDTLDTNLNNQWSYKTVTVNMDQFGCETCETGIDPKAVSCAIANRFYAKNVNEESGDFLFLVNALREQNKSLGVDVMPIMNKESQYCIGAIAGNCENCNEIEAITGIRLLADPTIGLDANVTVNFTGTLVPGSTTNSYYGQKERILKLINKAFLDNNVVGHAVVNEGISGSGRPCADFNILVNSCASVELLDGTGATITPCTAEYNPYTGKSFTNSPECLGCSGTTPWVPNAGVRVIGKGIKVGSNCLVGPDRKAWYHTEVRITSTPESDLDTFYVEEMQEVVVPENMGIQYHKMMLDMEVTGSGMDYPEGFMDLRGIYGTNKAERFLGNTLGLNQKGLYTSISMRAGLSHQETNVNGPVSTAVGQSWIIVESSDTATKAKIKAILDPWLASLPNPRGPLDLTTDDDQTNLQVDATGTVTQEPADETGE